MTAHPASTNIQVTWHIQDTSIDVFEYEVSVLEDDFVHETAHVRGKKKTFFDLDPCAAYKVSVQPLARTGRNIGNPSVQSVRTRASEPPTVLRLSALNITARNLTLSWERPATACEIAAYNITYSGVAKWGPRTEHTGSATIDSKNANTTTTIVIHGLLPYTDYTVTVTAFTDAGEGEIAVMNSTTQQDVPSEPTSLKPLDISARSITAVWREPLEQKGIVDSYSVTWYSSGKKAYSETTNHTVHIIAPLTPCTTYTVQVAGITKGGQGQHSKIEVTTKTEAPFLPADPTCHLNSEHTVFVTWAKPKTACPIIGFKVSCPGNFLEPNAMADIDVLPTVFSGNFCTVSALNFRVCVAAVVSDTIIGPQPQACCEPPKPTTPNQSPVQPVLPTTKKRASTTNSEVGQDQNDSSSTVMAIGVGVGVLGLLLFIVAIIVLVYWRYKNAQKQTPAAIPLAESQGTRANDQNNDASASLI